ncbi:YdeI family protein [Sporosarcina sp. Te-1]|uniref:YdeI/OmpD-associated family protein n=1 Tax=Sporosarcina sp. Te-1 TaxID=2818390 RepID=UPI001A9E8B3A|nr:YdeI family protein [Sporosarcina sp. Te-1]QTD41847.1 YdeI family protein [Sporosarcina sp. Te-1]
MTQLRTNPKVDEYMKKENNWKEESEKLRQILLECGLTEEFKWMHPCYTLEGKNVVLIHGFKEYCALLFHKGALMQDPHRILIQQTENVQAARQIRFTRVDEIFEKEMILKDYIKHAIAIEKTGLQVKKKTDINIPEELQFKFDENPALETAFKELTPGRQRAYCFYFSQAKQAKTREARVEKCIPDILAGKGLNDE